MTRQRARLTRTAVVGLALAATLAGCADGSTNDARTPTDIATQGTEDTPAPSPPSGGTDATDATDATDPTDPTDGAAPSDDETPAAIPEGFPDPETLVGQEAYDARDSDGDWRTVVGGEPLDLALVFGSCFDGGTGDVCGYSISASAPAGAEPSDAALLLLLSSSGESADGTPTWQVLDAAVTRTPDSPAVLQDCQGEDGVAFYPDDDAEEPGGSDTVPAAAAWGPDGDVTALVELDAAEVTCTREGP